MSFGFGFGFPRRLTSGGGLSPRLYLDFIGTGSLPSTVTFSRGTNATLTDSNGRIAWAPHNLLTNSEDFEAAAWTKDRVNVASNTVVAPDGTTTADKVTDTAAGANTYRIYNSVTLVAQPYTMTVYAKAAEYSWCYLRIGNALRAWYNLANGAVGTVDAGLTASVSDAGNGWYRLTCTIATATAGAGFGLVGLATGNGVESYTPTTGGMGIFIWGAQLNVANAPVNLLTWSEQFDNLTAWALQNVTVTANAVVAPDGTTTADRAVVTASSLYSALRSVNVTVTPNTTYTYSYWLNTSTSAPANTMRVFNVTGGVDIVTSQACVYSGGWVRQTCTFTTPAGCTAILIYLVSGTFAAGSFFDVWGAQLNTGSVALPYVATTSSIYLPPAYNSTTPKNLLGFTQEPENAAWTKSNSYVQQNQLTSSQNFSGTGWNVDGILLTADAGIAPDGSNTATSALVGTGNNRVYQFDNTGITGNKVFSIYVKPNAGNTISITSVGAMSPSATAVINAATGVITGFTGASATPAGNGWYRVSLPVNVTGASGNTTYWYISGPASSAFIWGAQLVSGSTAGDYTQTTSAAAPTRYLNWDGTLTGRKLVENTATNTHYAYQTPTLGVGVYTLSVYLKAAERTWALVNVFRGSTFSAYVDLSTGELGFVSGGTATVTNAGNGWWRAAITFTVTVAGASDLGVLTTTGNGTSSYTGDGTSGIYVSDFQLSNSASVDPYVYNPQAAAASAAYYGPRFDYNPTGSPVLGPQRVTNGDFSGGTTGWTQDANGLLSVVGGSLRVENGSALNSAAYQSFTTVVNSLYRASIQNTGATNLQVRIGTSAVGSQNYIATVSAGASSTFDFTATATTTFVTVRVLSATLGDFILVDNISVQEVTGYTATANGLLIEEQRTNLLTYSEQFDNAAWTKVAGSVSVSQNAVGPNGVLNSGATVTALAGTNNHWLYQSFASTAIAYSQSVYAKAGTASWIGIGFGAGATTDGVFFNLSNGTVGTAAFGSTGNIQNVGNGWYRCTVTRTGPGGTYFGALEVHTADNQALNWNAAGTETILVFGLNMEAGSFATSYIPTVASQVTRNADSASMLGDNFYTWYNPNQGTFSSNYRPITTATTISQDIFMANGGAPLTNSIGNYASAGTSVIAWSRVSGVTQVSFNRSVVADAAHKIAYAYAPSNFAMSADASAVGTLASGTLPPVDRLTFGANNISGASRAFWLRSFGYYNTRLPDSTLQALTTT